MSEEDLSLRDEIAAAVAATEEKVEESVVATEKVEEPTAKERDEQGRFKSKTEEAPPEKSEVEEQPQVEVEKPAVKLDASKAPSGWSPKVREKWSALDPEIQSQIIAREEASANGVRKIQEEATVFRSFAEGLAPYINEAVQNRQDPGRYIAGVMETERNLRSQDPQVKFNTLLNIADQYGIPLRDVLNQTAGTEVVPKTTQNNFQLPPEIQKELEESRQWRQTFQQQTQVQQVQQFAKGKEFFDDVRVMMADLIDSGAASDMDDAYEKACWAHPDVRTVLIDRQVSGGKKQDISNRQSQAVAAGLKSGGPTPVKEKKQEDENTSIADDIRAAIEASSGRV